MRKFSDFEKQVLDQIIILLKGKHTICAENILFDIKGIFGISSECGFHLITANDELQFVYNSKKFGTQDSFKTLYFNIIYKIYEYYFLMKYLEENGYIILTESNLEITKDDVCDTYTDFIPSTLSQKLKPYFSSIYYPTNQLIDLVEHDYLDYEAQQKKDMELRQEKIEKAQKRNFIITTFIAIVSLVSSLISLCSSISIKHGKLDITITDMEDEPVGIEIKNVSKNVPIRIEEPIQLEKQDPIPINVNITVNKEHETK